MPLSSKKAAGTRLADAIADRYGQSFSPWSVGTIKSVDSGNSCTVTILGDDYVGLYHLTSYTPVVGQSVVLLGGGGQLLILGALGAPVAGGVTPAGGGGTSAVTSVQGRTGAVTISAADLSLAAVASSGAYSDIAGKPSLATVATSGAYADLAGKPTLSTVATSGSYSNLTNKPAVITVSGTSSSYTLTTTNTSVTGTPATFTTTHANAIAVVQFFFDIEADSAMGTSGSPATVNRFVGYVGLDGVRQTAPAVVFGTNTAFVRATQGSVAKLTIAAPGSHTIDLWASSNGTTQPIMKSAVWVATVYDGF